jgi:hypothetical protein
MSPTSYRAAPPRTPSLSSVLGWVNRFDADRAAVDCAGCGRRVAREEQALRNAGAVGYTAQEILGIETPNADFPYAGAQETY